MPIKSEGSPSATPTEGGDDAVRSVPMRGNRIQSRDLFLNQREIIIDHGSDGYRLRLTSQNKLILTK